MRMEVVADGDGWRDQVRAVLADISQFIDAEPRPEGMPIWNEQGRTIGRWQFQRITPP